MLPATLAGFADELTKIANTPEQLARAVAGAGTRAARGAAAITHGASELPMSRIQGMRSRMTTLANRQHVDLTGSSLRDIPLPLSQQPVLSAEDVAHKTYLRNKAMSVLEGTKGSFMNAHHQYMKANNLTS